MALWGEEKTYLGGTNLSPSGGFGSVASVLISYRSGSRYMPAGRQFGLLFEEMRQQGRLAHVAIPHKHDLHPVHLRHALVVFPQEAEGLSASLSHYVHERGTHTAHLSKRIAPDIQGDQ